MQSSSTGIPAQNETPHATAIPHNLSSWLPPDIRRLPGADLAAAAYDLTQGIALVLAIVEQSDSARDEDTDTPLLDKTDCCILLRYAIASAQALNLQAWQWIEWLQDHGAQQCRPGAAVT
jgi:hypothetical protein